MKRLIPVLLLLVALAACGGSPTSPSVLQVAGTWTGTITSNQVSGSGPASITIGQSGSSLTGTWTATGPGGPGAGSMSGALSGATVTMTLTPSVPGTCPYAVTVTVNGVQMTGTYAATNCTVAGGGGITLTKQ